MLSPHFRGPKAKEALVDHMVMLVWTADFCPVLLCGVVSVQLMLQVREEVIALRGIGKV